MKITGPSAQGSAGVLGTSINPINVYMQYQRQRDQQNYLQQQEARKKRDALIDYTAKYNPQSKWAVRQGEITQMAQQLRNYTQQRLHQGISPDQIKMEQAQMEGMINNRMAEHSVWMKTYEDASAKIKADPKYNEEALSRLNDKFFKYDMTATDPDFVRQQIGNIDHEIMYNPELMNSNVVTKKFMDGLSEQNRQTRGNIEKADGTYLTSAELTAKLPYLRDNKGEVVIDPHTQQPIPVVNDNLYTLAMGSQDMRLMMQKFGGDTRAGQEAWLKKVLPGQDKVSYKEDIKGGFKKTEGERTAGDTATAIDERFKNNEAIVSGFRPDLLASTFDPYKSHQVEYLGEKSTPEGKAFVPIVKEEKGIYYDAEGKRVSKPTKLRVSFTKGGLTDFQMAMINTDSSLTEAQKKDKIDKLQEEMGKLNTKDFDITTKPGKRAAHHVLNRLLDEFLPPKERQAEGYTKKIGEYYDQGKTGGVY